MAHATDAERLAFRSAKGNLVRLRNENKKLRAEIALLKLKCENRDLLLAITRMLVIHGEALEELLDKRKQQTATDYDTLRQHSHAYPGK